MGRGRLLLVMAALVAALCAFPAAANAQDDGPDGEVVDLLKQLIQTNTSNPPGNEQQIAELLKARLAPLGFETEIIPTPTPGKAHFIARLRAANPTAKPLLLAGHEDVVGVERDLWSVDPFAGLVRGGDIFGRGAMDFKGGLAAFTVAASRIARAKPALTRDVILLAEADEEGGDYGTGWLAKTNYAKIDAGVSLNEGGWVFEDGGGTPRLMGITTIDKNSLSVTLETRGTSTHSSRPLPDSALARLTRALNRIERYEPATPKLSKTQRGYLRAWARGFGGRSARDIRKLLAARTAKQRRRATRRLARGNYGELFNGLLRTIYVPTIVDGGFRSNVLPGQAEATVNIRLLPGATPRPAIRELKRVIGDRKVKVTPIGTDRRVGRTRRSRASRSAPSSRRRASTPSSTARSPARASASGRRPGSRRRCSRRAPTPCRGASAASRSTASTRTRSRATSWPTCTATTSTSRSAASKRARTCSPASSAPPPRASRLGREDVEAVAQAAGARLVARAREALGEPGEDDERDLVRAVPAHGLGRARAALLAGGIDQPQHALVDQPRVPALRARADHDLPAGAAAELGGHRGEQQRVAAARGEHLVEPQALDRLAVRAEVRDQQLGERAGALAAARPGGEQRAREVVELRVELGPVDRSPRRGNREQRLAHRGACAAAQRCEGLLRRSSAGVISDFGGRS